MASRGLAYNQHRVTSAPKLDNEEVQEEETKDEEVFKVQHFVRMRAISNPDPRIRYDKGAREKIGVVLHHTTSNPNTDKIPLHPLTVPKGAPNKHGPVEIEGAPDLKNVGQKQADAITEWQHGPLSSVNYAFPVNVQQCVYSMSLKLGYTYVNYCHSVGQVLANLPKGSGFMEFLIYLSAAGIVPGNNTQLKQAQRMYENAVCHIEAMFLISYQKQFENLPKNLPVASDAAVGGAVNNFHRQLGQIIHEARLQIDMNAQSICQAPDTDCEFYQKLAALIYNCREKQLDVQEDKDEEKKKRKQQ